MENKVAIDFNIMVIDKRAYGETAYLGRDGITTYGEFSVGELLLVGYVLWSVNVYAKLGILRCVLTMVTMRMGNDAEARKNLM